MNLSPSLQHWLNSGRFFVHQDRQIFYRRGGSGSTFLGVHGYPTSSYDFHKMWPKLTQEFDVLMPDMLGMGFSDKPWGDHYAIRSHADMFEALLQRLQITECYILAHDLGVRVVQELLARKRINILGVVFLNGGLFAEVYEPRLTQKLLSSPLGHVLGPAIPWPLFDKAMRKMFGDNTQPTPDEMRIFWQLVNYKKGRWVTHLVGRFTKETEKFRDRWVLPLSQAKVPMRMVNGAVDPNSGDHMAKRYAEIVPNPDIVSLPDVGHWPQFEAPDAVFTALMDFVQQHTKASPNLEGNPAVNSDQNPSQYSGQNLDQNAGQSHTQSGAEQ